MNSNEPLKRPLDYLYVPVESQEKKIAVLPAGETTASQQSVESTCCGGGGWSRKLEDEEKDVVSKQAAAERNQVPRVGFRRGGVRIYMYCTTVLVDLLLSVPSIQDLEGIFLLDFFFVKNVSLEIRMKGGRSSRH